VPGPAPKSEATRQRRSMKKSMSLVANPEAEVPALPDPPETVVRDDEGAVVERSAPAWHPVVLDEWAEIWRSPMASQYTPTDGHGLLQLMVLTQLFWSAEDGDKKKQLHAEIRLARRDFGLTPMARASLHWQILDTEEKAERRNNRRRESGQSAEDELAILGQ
jgi:hypothetical protein